MNINNHIGIIRCPSSSPQISVPIYVSPSRAPAVTCACACVGVQQSAGWEHYAIHEPEPHVLLFRRPLTHPNATHAPGWYSAHIREQLEQAKREALARTGQPTGTASTAPAAANNPPNLKAAQ